MPKFYASTSKGLAEVLKAELEGLGLKVLETDRMGCLFESPWSGCFKANLYSRLATRISLPVLDFSAYKEEEIYNNLSKHDFTKYLGPDQSLMIKASLGQSSIRDQRMVALKAKDAIVDQFWKKFDRRPDVEKDKPDIRIFIHGFKNQFTVAVDTSGKSLSERGYRKDGGEAPLREHLAAGILDLMKWDHKTPIIDPMCGSGTFLIEAALKAAKIAPGTSHTKFAFQNFSHVNSEEWEGMLDQAISEEVEDMPVMFYGYDKDGRALDGARRNAERAGVDHMISFQRRNADVFEPPEEVEKGIILTNPPYGIRLGDEFFLEELYKNFSHQLKTNCKGWDLWVLSGNAELTKHLRMKSTNRWQVYNGNLDCRLINYKLNQ